MNQNKRERILNWAVAAIITANSLCWMLPNSVAPLAIIMLAAIFCLFYCSGSHIITVKIVCLVAFCLFFFLEAVFTQLLPNPYVSKYLLEFMTLGFGGILAAQAPFTPLKVFRNVAYLSLIVLPFLLRMDLTLSDATDFGQWMGISYACVKYVIALLLLLFFIKIHDKKLQLLFCASLIIYLSVFMTMASRGAILAIIVSMALFWMINRGYKISNFLIISIIVGLLVVTFWDSLIYFIFTTLEGLGIHFYALEKIVKMEATGNLTNGRSDIMLDALTYFSKAPILGQGVAIYEYFNNRYVHNVFVQLLIEGGAVLFVVIGWYLLKAFRLIFSDSLTIDQRYFMAFLIGSGLIELQFSNYLWRSQCFWMLIGYAMRFPLKKIKK